VKEGHEVLVFTKNKARECRKGLGPGKGSGRPGANDLTGWGGVGDGLYYRGSVSSITRPSVKDLTTQEVKGGDGMQIAVADNCCLAQV